MPHLACEADEFDAAMAAADPGQVPEEFFYNSSAHRLLPGAQYIDYAGLVIPVADIRGERRGQFIYPTETVHGHVLDDGNTGYQIRTRRATTAELRAQTLIAPLGASTGDDPLADWK